VFFGQEQTEKLGRLKHFVGRLQNALGTQTRKAKTQSHCEPDRNYRKRILGYLQQKACLQQP